VTPADTSHFDSCIGPVAQHGMRTHFSTSTISFVAKAARGRIRMKLENAHRVSYLLMQPSGIGVSTRYVSCDTTPRRDMTRVMARVSDFRTIHVLNY
jgi:hypothetical protein